MNNDRATELVKILWDYALLHHSLKKADMIFVLGSHDLRTAEWAAKLYQDGWAPLVVFSGGFGQRSMPAGNWKEPEAYVLAAVAITQGVPKDKIICEDRATNTGENVLFTKALLEEKGIPVRTIIAVQKPYMERRTYATIRQRWPEVDVVISAPPLGFEEYVAGAKLDQEIVMNKVVGDFQRLKVYAEKGWSIPQEVPAEVWRAYEELVGMGYGQDLAT